MKTVKCTWCPSSTRMTSSFGSHTLNNTFKTTWLGNQLPMSPWKCCHPLQPHLLSASEWREGSVLRQHFSELERREHCTTRLHWIVTRMRMKRMRMNILILFIITHRSYQRYDLLTSSLSLLGIVSLDNLQLSNQLHLLTFSPEPLMEALEVTRHHLQSFSS